MIELLSFRVVSLDLDYLDIFWEFKTTTLRSDRLRIMMERSVDGPAGPWREIAGPFYNTGQLRDPNVNLIHSWRAYAYRLKITDLDTGIESTFDSATLELAPDLIGIEMRRRMQLVLQEFNGTLCTVFPAITSGFRCPNCFDQNARGQSTGRALIQNCPSCFELTFVGGYSTPVDSWIQLDPSAKQVTRSDTYVKAPEEATARLSYFPPLKPKDMIVEVDNTRWEVQSVTTTKKGRAVVHQEAMMRRIPRGDIRYKVPVNVDPSRQTRPEREFSRPMSLDGDADDRDGNLGDFLDRALDD